MDLTQGTLKHKKERSKKMMLWFGMVSMMMMFIGLTSAFIVSMSRPDWTNSLDLPQSFYWSTMTILLSSISIHIALKKVKSGERWVATSMLWITLLLAGIFTYLQFQSFNYLMSEGYYFTGPESTITTTFIYLIVLSHLTHLAGGVIVLLVLIYNHFKQRYRAGQTLGLELGVTFWHFVDVLWIFLFLFLYFLG